MLTSPPTSTLEGGADKLKLRIPDVSESVARHNLAHTYAASRCVQCAPQRILSDALMPWAEQMRPPCPRSGASKSLLRPVRTPTQRAILQVREACPRAHYCPIVRLSRRAAGTANDKTSRSRAAPSLRYHGALPSVAHARAHAPGHATETSSMLRRLWRDPKMRGMRFANPQDTSKLRRLSLKSMPATLYSYLAALLLLVSCASQWGARAGRVRPMMCEHTKAFVAASSASQSSRELVGEQV